MGKNESMLQPSIPFLLGTMAAVLFIMLLYQSSFSGNGERSREIFASGNATQVTVSKEIHSFHENKYGVENATQVTTDKEIHSFDENNNLGDDQEIFPDLLPLLKKAATDDKTVIITSVNEAWAAQNSLLDIFLDGFHIGEKIEHLLNHLIVVALDPNAFQRCKTVHRFCYFLKVEGANFTTEKVFMSKEYIDLVWSKVRLQRRILELGYNFLFTDVDVLWLRNPFKHITVYADLTTSSDQFAGDPDEIHNYPNTGFIYVKSTKKTIKMMKYWHDAREKFPPNHEQNIFNFIKEDLVNQLGMKVQYIDTKYCGGFCNHGKDLNKICTMHANCCVGLGAKLHDLRSVVDDWKKYTTLPIEEKRKGWFTWRVPGFCIH
ncbi:hypothetical protein LUZ60_011160 [Juncus effusus]|nr:hypothetical protein LUZ60_011160 [Juncus effusus]